MPNSGNAVSSAMAHTILVPALKSNPARVRVCCSRICGRACLRGGTFDDQVRDHAQQAVQNQCDGDYPQQVQAVSQRGNSDQCVMVLDINFTGARV